MAINTPHYREEVLRIPGPQADLLGVLTTPRMAQPPRTGVLVVVGGAQYRTGSHRQFVHLARTLAQAGHPVLRFDLTGMGDSPGLVAPFDATEGDVGAAVQALLVAAPSLQKVVLWGLCDGASASLLYVQRTQDRRVAGVVMLNPWVRSETSLAQAKVRQYYPKRLLEWGFWSKLLRGQVGTKALRDLGRNLLTSTTRRQSGSEGFQHRMAEGLRLLRAPVLVLLCERDLTAQEFSTYTRSSSVWRQVLNHPSVTQHTIPGADHTCSTPGSQVEVERLTLAWLARL